MYLEFNNAVTTVIKAIKALDDFRKIEESAGLKSRVRRTGVTLTKLVPFCEEFNIHSDPNMTCIIFELIAVNVPKQVAYMYYIEFIRGKNVIN